MDGKSLKISLILSSLFFFSLLFQYPQKIEAGMDDMKSGPVEVNGDVVEYSVDGNKVTARGNVVITRSGMTLTCDRVEFSRDTKVAVAEGNVRLQTNQGDKEGELRGEKLTFNFETRQGEFNGAKVYFDPYYGMGRKITRVSDEKMLVRDGYVSTCDHDKPHFRLGAKKLDVYPGQKLIARSVRMMIGNVPIMYLPRMTQRLDGKEPIVTFTPGSKKDWGAFVLSTWNHSLNDKVKLILHVDARALKGIAEGVDVKYNTSSMGSGTMRTYYMNERTPSIKNIFQKSTIKPVYRERFKGEWRHKWQIDKDTSAIWQYYKLSDPDLLKDYFRREFDRDPFPQTFFLLTRNFTHGTLSLRNDKRVNNFTTKVERLPEINYDLSDTRLGDSKFYIKNSTTYSNLSSKLPSPTEVRTETMRLDTENILSYQSKLGIFEIKPFVGSRETYYSKTLAPAKNGSIRGIFETGSSVSTKFFRVFDVDTNIFGVEIHRLRHIITPTVLYQFNTVPTHTSDELPAFDGIDSLTNIHNINFSIENKLQTKRNDKTVDLLRVLVGTNFHLKEDPRKGGFDVLTSDIDFKPADWLSLYFDSNYDTKKGRLNTANFDFYINNKDKWSIGVGKRLAVDVDDQITTELKYKINPKWSVKYYRRFDIDNGLDKEQNIVVTRDLHEWTVDLNFNERRGEGSEIFMIFTLKAFPEMAIDFGSSFNRRKAGAQSPEGE